MGREIKDAEFLKKARDRFKYCLESWRDIREQHDLDMRFLAGDSWDDIELRNRKEEAETVNVLERHYGDWKIHDNSHPFKKLDSESMEFVVILKPNEVKTVRYTVETRW
jgi:hypothetical protein